MPTLSAPAKPPVPAAAALQKAKITPPVPTSQGNPPPATKRPLIPKSLKKFLFIIGGVFTVIIALAIGFFIFNSLRSSSSTPTDQITTTPTNTPTPTIGIPTIPPPHDIPLEPDNLDWDRLISEQGGLYYDYPANFKLKESSNLYQTLQPTWYDAGHYFDCINRQVGSVNPFPCWVFSLEITTADPQKIGTGSARLNSLIANQTNYTDGLGRNWQIAGPIETQLSFVYFAESEVNQVVYQLKTQSIIRSMREYIKSHPDRPFAKNITETDNQSLVQAHLSLLHEVLSTFQTFRKPFITEPQWLRHRFTNNWSIAYPETAQLFSRDQATLSTDQEGLIEGWYGNGDFVSLHKYSILLTTPNMDQYPPSSSTDIDQWVNFDLAGLSQNQREQVQVVGIPKRRGRRNQKQVEFETRTLLNLPNQLSLFLDSHFYQHPIHRAYIWEFDELPPRTVTIRQLDGLYETAVMQQLLSTFIKKIYE